MTYSPQSYLDIRALFRAKTGLPPESLGIQHYSPQGGGYHEGNDLLTAAGRLDSDYSKRESERDRPGTNGASAIDIGEFDVTLHNGRRVTLRTLNHWMEANWHALDAQWLREWIYSLDGITVKRLDRLGIRFSGDTSHRTHSHGSGFRDEENTPKVPLFQRFWAEMEGETNMLAQGDDHDRQLLVRVSSLARGDDTAVAPPGWKLAVPSEPQWLVRTVKDLDSATQGLLEGQTALSGAIRALDTLVRGMGGLSTEDRAAIQDLTAAVRELNSRLASP